MSRSIFARSPRLPQLRAAVLPPSIRLQSTFAKAQTNGDSLVSGKEVSPTSSSRWLSELRARCQQLASANYPARCNERALELLEQTDAKWMELLAGSHGFLTQPEWRGLDNYQLLWGDMDSMLVKAHINNVMYNRYIESGRVQFIRHHGQDAPIEEQQQWDDLVTPRSLGLILKKITTEFKFPMKYPDRIHVLYRLTEPPTQNSTSLNMEAWILSDKHRRVAAKCVDETAIYDYRTKRTSVLKPFMVEKLQKTYKMQEESNKTYEAEARKAIAAVEELESEFQ